MTKLFLAVALGLSLAPLAANATTVNTFSNGALGAVSFPLAIDSCQSVFIGMTASAAGTHNLSQPSTANYVRVSIFYSNSCTGSGFFEDGSANVQFSAQGAANGTKVPTSITASGVVPMTCLAGGCTSDRLKFKMTLTAAGPAMQVMDTSHTTYPLTPPVTVKMHSDSNQVGATGSLTISTQILGAIPIPPLVNGTILDTKSHSVSTTY